MSDTRSRSTYELLKVKQENAGLRLEILRLSQENARLLVIMIEQEKAGLEAQIAEIVGKLPREEDSGGGQ